MYRFSSFRDLQHVQQDAIIFSMEAKSQVYEDLRFDRERRHCGREASIWVQLGRFRSHFEQNLKIC